MWGGDQWSDVQGSWVAKAHEMTFTTWMRLLLSAGKLT